MVTEYGQQCVINR